MKKTLFPKSMWILILFACVTFNIHAVVHITAPLASEYSWYYNGELIPGENDRILRAEDAGVYMVEMVKEDGSQTKEFYNLSASGTVRKLIFIGDSTASMYDINRFPRTG
ncbi:MAG: hypothetical protein LUG18_09475 [Candidatus Azobacteroides sp.]|nr:hypothetical protein [Candidatus Azobacteroides sp.]